MSDCVTVNSMSFVSPVVANNVAKYYVVVVATKAGVKDLSEALHTMLPLTLPDSTPTERA